MSRKGYLPHALVKAVVFWTLVVCILSATVAGILNAWEALGDEGAGRCITTAVILACGSVTFLFVNCLFGELGTGLFTTLLSSSSPPPPPNIDPAFGERLRRAKGLTEDSKDSLAS